MSNGSRHTGHSNSSSATGIGRRHEQEDTESAPHAPQAQLPSDEQVVTGDVPALGMAGLLDFAQTFRVRTDAQDPTRGLMTNKFGTNRSEKYSL